MFTATVLICGIFIIFSFSFIYIENNHPSVPDSISTLINCWHGFCFSVIKCAHHRSLRANSITVISVFTSTVYNRYCICYDSIFADIMCVYTLPVPVFFPPLLSAPDWLWVAQSIFNGGLRRQRSLFLTKMRLIVFVYFAFPCVVITSYEVWVLVVMFMLFCLLCSTVLCTQVEYVGQNWKRDKGPIPMSTLTQTLRLLRYILHVVKKPNRGCARIVTVGRSALGYNQPMSGRNTTEWQHC